MVVLLESASEQTFKIIPRSYVADSMVIVEEGAGVSTTYAITPTRVSYDDTLDASGTYMSIAKIVALEEDKFYTLTVLNGADVIYKTRIFCTSQTPQTYSINNGVYTPPTQTDNDYIVI